MRHNSTTVFSHTMVGRVCTNPPLMYRQRDNMGPVGQSCIMYRAPSSHKTTSCDDLSRRAVCCLDLIWTNVLLPFLTPCIRYHRA